MMDFESAAIRIGTEYVRRCAEAVSERAKEFCRDDEVRDTISCSYDGLHAQVYAKDEGAVSEEFGTYKNPAHPFMTPAISVIKEGLL